LLFKDKRCVECHSAAGQGGKVGPDLAERSLHRSMTQFAAAMWNKAPAMTAAMKARGIGVPRLEAAEMADIVAYLYSVRYFAAPGDARTGRELAAAKGCLECHSLGGGEKAGPDLMQVKGLDSAATVIAAMWNHSFITGRRKAEKAPWPQFTSEEMASLVAYLQRLARERT
jgi:mono/diheme cytochrome c family protein